MSIYKIVNINKKTYENNGIESIVDDTGTLELNEKHIEEKLGHKNLPAITNKYDQMYKMRRNELVNNSKKESNWRFLRSNLALKIIIDCRTDKPCNFKTNLRFKLHDVINAKEQTVLNSIKDPFEEEDMKMQYSILGYRIDFYFYKYKLVIEVDEWGHGKRNFNEEIERQKLLEKELNCVFIRINPDEKNFNIYREITKIHRHINKPTKNVLIDNFSKKIARIRI